MPGLTPFQTLGPFFSFALPFPGGDALADESTPGARIVVEGRVRDGASAPISDALVEIWQANARGQYRHPLDPDHTPPEAPFDGFGRTSTDDEGRYSFATIKPGAVPAPHGGSQAPHIVVGLLGRGILTRLVTRIYFEDEPANAADPVLGLVPAERRPTLLARRRGADRYEFDIVVQGPGETVFFDV
jgi:protocatechuate 3,4-dioxygenase alpha subunit